MKPGVRNFLAITSGIIIGSTVNMLIISMGGDIFPAPAGVDPENLESIQANIHLYETKHYIAPFLAHALGTLVAAFISVKLAVRRKRIVSIIVGAWFLIGGIVAASMIGTPFLPAMVDLVFAYLPFAWLGLKLAR